MKTQIPISEAAAVGKVLESAVFSRERVAIHFSDGTYCLLVAVRFGISPRSVSIHSDCDDELDIDEKIALGITTREELDAAKAERDRNARHAMYLKLQEEFGPKTGDR